MYEVMVIVLDFFRVVIITRRIIIVAWFISPMIFSQIVKMEIYTFSTFRIDYFVCPFKRPGLLQLMHMEL